MATPGRKRVYAWALYDWANSAFATTVIAGFFPVFFRQYWSAGENATVTTLRLGTANSLSSITVALMAPVLGAVADRGGAKKRFLGFFAAVGIVMTGSLYFVSAGEWQAAVVVFALASVGFSASIIFYDSLLPAVVEGGRTDYTSAFGYALGYLGGGLLFVVNVLMTLKPHLFGLTDASQAVRVSFITVAVWWAVFSVPLFRAVPEPVGGMERGWAAVASGLSQLRRTFHDVRKLRVVLLFLGAYFLYIDGVQTIARMGVDYGMSLGFDAKHLIIALLVTQFVGFPAALVFGKVGERVGAKKAIYFGIAMYTAACIFGFFMKRVSDFYVLALTIGLVQGGIQSLSRSLYTRIIPRNKAAEFFGFYNMLGKFSTVIGPVLMGWAGVLTGDPRYSVLSIILLFFFGGILLRGVDESRGAEAAEALEHV